MIKAGLFSSSSSLVIVPDLSNLSSAEALLALSAVELLVGTTSTTTSGANSSNNGKIASQSILSGTLVERYSSVNYVTYDYQSSPPPPPPPPCQNIYTFTYYDGGCNYSIYDCTNTTYLGSTRVTSCSSPGTDSSGATIPGCSNNCAPPPPPPPPPSVTCNTSSIVSNSGCPSGYIQNFICSDGSSYSQCI